MNDFNTIQKIKSLSDDISTILEEVTHLVSTVKDPLFVKEANLFLNLFDDAVEACDDSINEYLEEDTTLDVEDDDDAMDYDSMDYESDDF